MSKKSLPKEMLSAYFDDEVSPEERAQVSRAVEKTPALKQVLKDYGQLSDSIRSLQQDVSSPGLRNAVLEQIRPETMPEPATSGTKLGRRWVMIAGGVMTAAAAGLLVMIWPASPYLGSPPTDVAMVPTQESAESSAIVLADSAAPSGSALSSRESEIASGGLHSEDIPALSQAESEIQSEDSPIRSASLPFESLLEHVPEGQDVPKPGDVIKYLEKVADETVWITLTVVDVQMVAGQIQVLLANHGINSPVDPTEEPVDPNEEPVDPNAEGDENGESANDTNVVILVESDWGKLEEVVADLQTQEYSRSEDVSSSVAKQKDQMIAQNLVEPQSRQSESDAEGRANLSSVEHPILSQAAPATPPVGVSSAQAKSRSEPHHAQYSANVSDKDINVFELKGRLIFTESMNAVDDPRPLAETEEQKPATNERTEPEVDVIFARHAPVRAVILLKKSK